MSILVVGASGATGRLVVKQLLNLGESVRVIVRSKNDFNSLFNNEQRLSITEASLLNLSDSDLVEQVKDCDAVVSCLGHNLSFKGMYCPPRRLVSQSVQRLSQAIITAQPSKPIKFILMNTTGNQNLARGEKISIAQSFVIGLIRFLVPPHADNEQAARFLQSQFGHHQHFIEWVAIRPDSLIDEDLPSDYEVYPSPIRSAIFDAGKTSRINVAQFMKELIVNNDTWQQWKNDMPVIYNQ